jgi:hypothetical protein
MSEYKVVQRFLSRFQVKSIEPRAYVSAQPLEVNDPRIMPAQRTLQKESMNEVEQLFLNQLEGRLTPMVLLELSKQQLLEMYILSNNNPYALFQRLNNIPGDKILALFDGANSLAVACTRIETLPAIVITLSMVTACKEIVLKTELQEKKLDIDTELVEIALQLLISAISKNILTITDLVERGDRV